MEDLIHCYRVGRLRLSPGAALAADSQFLYVISDRVLKLGPHPTNVISSLSRLADGVSYAELCGDAESVVDVLDVTLRLLIETGFVIRDASNSYQGTEFERQVEYFAALGLDGNAAQRTLEAATVAILGLGGIGSVVLQHLLAAGVRSYVLIDGDHVQLCDLNRQFIYRAGHVGVPKVDAARDFVFALGNRSSVARYHSFVTSLADLRGMQMPEQVDILVLTADHPIGELERIVAAYCRERSLAHVAAGCGLETAVWGPLITKETIDRFMHHVDDARASAVFPMPTALLSASFGATNSIVGAFLARDVVHYLVGATPLSLGRLVVLDFAVPSVRPFSVLDQP